MSKRSSKHRPKYQHYIPRLHLKHFVGEQPKNMVWTYDSQQNSVRNSTVENTGGAANFYSIRQNDGTYYDALENWLAEVESAAAAPYAGLLNGDFPTGQARMDFATFVAALFARSPSMIRAHAEAFAHSIQMEMDIRWGTRERFDAFLDRYEADVGKVADRDNLFAFWHDKDRFWIEISQKRGLPVMGVADQLREILFDRHWYLVHAAEDYFITCDSPVIKFVDPTLVHPIYGDGGFKNAQSEVTLPLSPSMALLITGQRFTHRNFYLPKEHVWNFNGARAVYAERFLYAHLKDERVRQLAADHKNDRFRYELGWEKGFSEVKLTR